LRSTTLEILGAQGLWQYWGGSEWAHNGTAQLGDLDYPILETKRIGPGISMKAASRLSRDALNIEFRCWDHESVLRDAVLSGGSATTCFAATEPECTAE
jgi:hypothetical protein